MSEAARALSVSMIARRAKAVADGVCTVCLLAESSAGRRTCERCRETRRNVTNKSVAKRKARGSCAHCVDPVVPGKKLCQHHLDYHRNNTRKIKKRTMDQYGGACVCCGEAELDFLTIDHIHEDGAAHRREIGPTKKSGVHFYLWLKKNEYPSGFQVLCMNCNLSKHNNDGLCAHKAPKRVEFAPRPRGRRDRMPWSTRIVGGAS